MPWSRRRLVLPLSLLAGACATPPRAEPPPIAGHDAFDVEYRGEVTHAAVPTIPAPAPQNGQEAPPPAPAPLLGTRPLTPRVRTHLVTVHTRLVGLPTPLARQLLPDLFRPREAATGGSADGETTVAVPKAGTTAATGTRPAFGSLPRDRQQPVEGTTHGVHVDGAAIDAAIDQLLAEGRATELDGPQVVCAEGASATVSTTDEQSLVQGLDLRPGSGLWFATGLHVEPVQHGIWLAATPRRQGPEQLELELDLQWRELVLPVPQVATRFGVVHLPTLVVQRLRCHAPVARRDTLVLGALSGPSSDHVVVAVVHVTAEDSGTSSLVQ